MGGIHIRPSASLNFSVSARTQASEALDELKIARNF